MKTAKHRLVSEAILARAAEFPVVTIMGPRQCGKTTTAREVFPTHHYANLESPKIRELAQTDADGFFAKFPPPVIIDEIQRVPELLSSIQVRVDEDRHHYGQFILTGSHQPALHEAVSQSLAGRTALIRMLPLSIEELKTIPAADLSADGLILRGGMPDVQIHNHTPQAFFRNYYATYIERDVRQIASLVHVSEFERFVRLLAGRIGQLVNFDALSGEVGVSRTTIAGWMDVLEASFLVFRLRPYHTNLGKRLVKTPKVYFTDTGLACWLLGIATKEQLARDPLRGNLFENLVVLELMKKRFIQDVDPGLYFLRTSNGTEVDVIAETASRITPVEIKSAMTYTPNFARSIKSLFGDNPAVRNPTVVYAGEAYPSWQGVRVVNYLDSCTVYR